VVFKIYTLYHGSLKPVEPAVLHKPLKHISEFPTNKSFGKKCLMTNEMASRLAMAGICKSLTT